MDTAVEFSRVEFDEPDHPEDDAPDRRIEEFCANAGLERVLVSPPVDDRISIWNGHSLRAWMAHDGDALRDALGRGSLAFRTSHEQAQHRHTGLASDGGRLVVIIPEWYYESPPWSGSPGYGFTTLDVHGQFTGTDEVSPATDTQWKSFAWFLIGKFEQAAARGDRLNIAVPNTSCTAPTIVSAQIGFDTRCHIEAWSTPDQEEGPETIAVSSATRQTLHDIGRALTDATRERAASPLQTLLTFSPQKGPRATFL